MTLPPRLQAALRSPRTLAVMAGAAAAVAHPPFGLLPGLLGWGLLMILWDRAAGPRPLRSAFLMGWLAGTAYFAIGCWWVAEAFLVDAANQGWMAPFAVAFLAAGLGLFWGLGGVVFRSASPRHTIAKAVVFAGVVTALEWLRGHVLTGFPWNLPGETWAAGSAPSQMASVVGAYGLTWITVLAAALLVSPLAYGKSRSVLAAAGAGASIVLAIYAYGAARLSSPPAPDPAAPVIRVVQADVRQEAKYDAARFTDIVERYLRLTTRPTARRPDIVIWPEGAIPAPINDLLAPDAWTRPAIARSLSPGQTLILGAARHEGDIWFNSLVALRRETVGLRVTALYDKHRLVPFGEYLPLDALISPLGVKKLVHIGDGFSSGPPPRPISPEGVPSLQPLICYEGLYPGFTRQGARQAGHRPRWILNISNDAWFGRTSGPWQHLNLASYRAIEEGLPLVRATPTGISAITDAFGRPQAALPMGAADVIDASLPPVAALTPYVAVGAWSMWVMILLSAAVAAIERFFANRRR